MDCTQDELVEKLKKGGPQRFDYEFSNIKVKGQTITCQTKTWMRRDVTIELTIDTQPMPDGRLQVYLTTTPSASIFILFFVMLVLALPMFSVVGIFANLGILVISWLVPILFIGGLIFNVGMVYAQFSASSLTVCKQLQRM